MFNFVSIQSLRLFVHIISMLKKQSIESSSNKYSVYNQIETIDFNISHTSDGSIIGSLCCKPLLDSCDQQTDVNFNVDSYDEFTHAVVSTFANLASIFSRRTDHHSHNTWIKRKEMMEYISPNCGLCHICIPFQTCSSIR